jgi:hypothetical protein
VQRTVYSQTVMHMNGTVITGPLLTTGQADWTAALKRGDNHRHDVIKGFAYSDEMTAKLLPVVDDGIAFA